MAKEIKKTREFLIVRIKMTHSQITSQGNSRELSTCIMKLHECFLYKSDLFFF